ARRTHGRRGRSVRCGTDCITYLEFAAFSATMMTPSRCDLRLVAAAHGIAHHQQLVFRPMPIAFKEWAVTVRALAEGEQLLTLRKGGIREEHKLFRLDHDRFFLYPTFDHQRNDVVRESHLPELRRALEEGVWPDGDPPPTALTE